MSTRSSRYPRMGMGSGIRSIGLNAYPTTTAAKIRAYHGVRGSLYARYRVYTSVFNPFARIFQFSMMDFIAPPSKIINGIWPCKQRKEYYPMDQDTFSLQ